MAKIMENDHFIEQINTIRKCYLKILKREPDEEGLNYYLEQMKSGRINLDDLNNMLRNSGEYKHLQSKESTPKQNQSDKIIEYIKNLSSDKEVKVIFGGHWSNHPEWLVLNEEDQDITQFLNFPNDSVNVIFIEHVIEHISFLNAITFMSEAKRILKPGGVFRIVCPMFEKIMNVDLQDENSKIYVQNSLVPAYSEENEILKKLKLKGVIESPKIFLFNSMFMKHNHKFIWSGELMIKILKSLNFRCVNLLNVGEGINPQYCIERRHRGLYLGNNWKEDLDWQSNEPVFDVESLVVEAIK